MKHEKTDFTHKYWLTKMDKKPNQICLSFVDSIYEINDKLDNNESIHADNEYVSIFHGSIHNFGDMIGFYEKNKEIIELELVLKLGDEFKWIPEKFESKKFTLEFFYEDTLEKLEENEASTLVTSLNGLELNTSR